MNFLILTALTVFVGVTANATQPDNKVLSTVDAGVVFKINKPITVPPPSAIGFRRGQPVANLGNSASDANDPYCMIFLGSGSKQDRTIQPGQLTVVKQGGYKDIPNTDFSWVSLQVSGVPDVAAVGCYGPKDQAVTIKTLKDSFGDYLSVLN